MKISNLKTYELRDLNKVQIFIIYYYYLLFPQIVVGYDGFPNLDTKASISKDLII